MELTIEASDRPLPGVNPGALRQSPLDSCASRQSSPSSLSSQSSPALRMRSPSSATRWKSSLVTPHDESSDLAVQKNLLPTIGLGEDRFRRNRVREARQSPRSNTCAPHASAPCAVCCVPRATCRHRHTYATHDIYTTAHVISWIRMPYTVSYLSCPCHSAAETSPSPDPRKAVVDDLELQVEQTPAEATVSAGEAAPLDGGSGKDQKYKSNLETKHNMDSKIANDNALIIDRGACRFLQ